MLVLTMVAGWLASCKTGGTQQPTLLATDSVTYVLPDSMCSCRIIADMPQGNDSLAMAIRSLVNSQLSLISLDNEGSHPYAGDMTDAQAMVDYYGHLCADTMRAMRAQIPEISCSYQAEARLLADCEHYATYRFSSYVYLGGAHGSAVDYAVNIAKPSGRVLTQTVDTTQITPLQPLLAAGVRAYLADQGQQVTDSEVRDLLFIDHGVIPLPTHAPYLTEGGLRFVYQQYEIGPYAMGMVSFTVPYDKIKPYMTTEALRLLPAQAKP